MAMWKLKRWTDLGSQSITLSADPSSVYDILIDYDNYLEWFPITSHSKLMVKEGDLAIAEFSFEKPPNSKLTMECIHTRNEMVLHRKIAGTFPLTRVQWNLQSEGTGTKVTLRTEMELSNWRVLYPGMAQNFVTRALLTAAEGRVSAFSSELQDQGGRKFLEIIETDESLEIWLMGKKYKLTPVQE